MNAHHRTVKPLRQKWARDAVWWLFNFIFFPNDDGTDNMKAERKKSSATRIIREEGRGASRSTMWKDIVSKIQIFLIIYIYRGLIILFSKQSKECPVSSTLSHGLPQPTLIIFFLKKRLNGGLQDGWWGGVCVGPRVQSQEESSLSVAHFGVSIREFEIWMVIVAVNGRRSFHWKENLKTKVRFIPCLTKGRIGCAQSFPHISAVVVLAISIVQREFCNQGRA